MALYPTIILYEISQLCFCISISLIYSLPPFWPCLPFSLKTRTFRRRLFISILFVATTAAGGALSCFSLCYGNVINLNILCIMGAYQGFIYGIIWIGRWNFELPIIQYSPVFIFRKQLNSTFDLGGGGYFITSVILTTLMMAFGNVFSSQPSVLEIPLGVACYIALIVFWELAKRLHQVILAQRLELAPTEPLLLALDKSILASGATRKFAAWSK
ncbi:hypothetical protein ACFE04_030128 [Oxalis oulophora]